MAELQDYISNTDIVFTRALTKTAMQYFAWPGLPHLECAKAILMMPADLRSIHTVFGRGIPMNLCIDFEKPISESEQKKNAAMKLVQETAEDAAEKLRAYFAERQVEVSRQLMLLSPNPSKVSFHVHVELCDTGFSDYVAVKDFIAPLAQTMPGIDMHIYRHMGSLRMYRCRKADGKCEIEVCPRSWKGVHANIAGLSEEELMRMSFCVCDPAAMPKKLITPISVRHSVPTSRCGTVGSVASVKKGLPAAAVPKDLKLKFHCVRFRGGAESNPQLVWEILPEVVASIPERFSDDYTEWIKVGMLLRGMSLGFSQKKTLPLYSFSEIDEKLKNIWVEFSKKSRKFELNACEKRWNTLISSERLGSVNWTISWRGLANRSTL